MEGDFVEKWRYCWLTDFEDFAKPGSSDHILVENIILLIILTYEGRWF